jgi:AcrR family transcriptional regulator
MPKAPATPEVVEAVRERILNEALAIINEEGYSGLSMRKLARHLGFTAKTIYNYYSNKDELYLMVLIKGFSDLVQEFRAACRTSADPLEKLSAAMHAYVRWGIGNKHYYNIMFSMDTPKYRDYRGTPMEKVAEKQNRIALELPEIGTVILKEVAGQIHSITEDEIPYRLMQLWTILHGIVSLSISRVTLEVWDFQGTIETILAEALRPFRPSGRRGCPP